MPEADFQETVIAAAKQSRWSVYHTHNSMHSESGFPDLIMVRGRRMLAVELKKVGKAPTMAQTKWLLALAMVPGVECYAWDQTDTDVLLEVLT